MRDQGLIGYAELLLSKGFTIYEPGPAWDFFIYSRVVDGQECFGTAQVGNLRMGYEHLMPIEPSLKYGSSMHVDGVPNDLTEDVARRIARPWNTNDLVGSQRNYGDKHSLARYTKRVPAKEGE